MTGIFSWRCWQVMLLLWISSLPVQAKVVEYDLVIEEQFLDMSGKGKKARVLTLNQGVPGPVLRFTEGDVAKIRVHNRLAHESTSIHWHGLVLPNEQDGVPHVTTPPIAPGSVHEFEFPLIHSGTYWYHSHTHLQEQSGIYGSIVVTPQGGERERVDLDHVVQVSDWTDRDPNEVYRDLLRGNEYALVRKKSMPSFWGALKRGRLGSYLHQQWTRMPAMDVSDVAYDAFLVNGKPFQKIPVAPGSTVKLRLINSAASTYFFAEWAAGAMTVVAADGTPVQPFPLKRLFFGMAETYDVLVKIPKEQSSGWWEFRLTAQDGSGHTSLFLGQEGEHHAAPDIPKPELYGMDHMLEGALHSDEDSIRESERPPAPYALLKSVRPSAFSSRLPRRTIPLRLTGDMERYQWGFNGKTMTEDAVIAVREGEVLRLELINDTMMHHPLHLHGHFFRLINQHGALSPLKHTVDLPPMGKAVIEFEANQPGDWMFHCHLLYHMMSGMTRVFAYENLPPQPTSQDAFSHPASTSPSHPSAHKTSHGHGHGLFAHGGENPVPFGNRVVKLGDHGVEPWAFWGQMDLMSHLTEGELTLRRRHDDLLFQWEVGWGNVSEPEVELDLRYERYFNPHLRGFLGMGYDSHEIGLTGVAGLRYRLPLLIWTELKINTAGDVRLTVEKEFQLTQRFSLQTEVSYDTRSEWSGGIGLHFALHEKCSFITHYHLDYGAGAGFQIRF